MNNFFSGWLSVGGTNRNRVAQQIQGRTNYRVSEPVLSAAITSAYQSQRYMTIRQEAEQIMYKAVYKAVTENVGKLDKTDRIVAGIDGTVYVLRPDPDDPLSFRMVGSYNPQ